MNVFVFLHKSFIFSVLTNSFCFCVASVTVIFSLMNLLLLLTRDEQMVWQCDSYSSDPSIWMKSICRNMHNSELKASVLLWVWLYCKEHWVLCSHPQSAEKKSLVSRHCTHVDPLQEWLKLVPRKDLLLLGALFSPVLFGFWRALAQRSSPHSVASLNAWMDRQNREHVASGSLPQVGPWL